MRRMITVGLTVMGILVVVSFGRAQVATPSPEEDHQASILGLRVGMSAQGVMEHLKRRADAGRDVKDHTILSWKLARGNLLRVDFWKDHVAAVRLIYKHPRPTTDLWLVPLVTPASSTGLTAPDPRWHRDYKVTQDQDQMHVVWTRDVKVEEGFRVRIAFWSVSREAKGERYGEYVELKDVSVDPDDIGLYAAWLARGNGP